MTQFHVWRRLDEVAAAAALLRVFRRVDGQFLPVDPEPSRLALPRVGALRHGHRAQSLTLRTVKPT